MSKHKTSEISGALLDAAVALAEGDNLPDFWRDPDDGTCWARPGREEWSPSSRWDQGGPIIERERIMFTDLSSLENVGNIRAHIARRYGSHWADGETHLIAAMRAYVSSKFGDEVSL